jgi:hypothetical protein
MDEPRLDLSALDPTRDPAKFDRLVAATMRRARPELLRRAAAPSPWGTIARWMQPMLAAAAITALVSGWVLTNGTRGGLDDGFVAHAQPATLSALVDEWVTETRTPSVNDLMLALDEELP